MQGKGRARSSPVIPAVVFAAGLAPAAWLVWKGFNQDLGATPIEFITHATGTWTLRFLLITLAITPLRKLLGLPQLIRFRRMLGLFAFFYGSLHMLTYVWLDQFFDLGAIVKDIGKRPFITAGMTAFLLLIPLAVTSTAGWIRRMGGKRWRMLHRLIYASAAAGVVHYYWLVKSDVRRPVAYAAVLAILLSYRLAALFVRRRRLPSPSHLRF
ncbi:MAG: sulfoxide reductase heme-binding subunit YedZ [Acidobacteria bacterium]|nr:sulfoxide reductase heme-binding subunit YedZ [Acidobacteriota bacterium]